MLVHIKNNKIVDIVHSPVHLKTRMLPIDRYQEVQEPKTKPLAKDYETVVRRKPELVDGVPTHTYVVIELSVAKYKLKVKDRVTEYRYKKEISGTTLDDGTKVQTDRESRAAAVQLLNAFKDGSVTLSNWKVNGDFILVDQDKMQEIVDAQNIHVSNRFNAEAVSYEAIDALETNEEIRTYDFRSNF